MPKMALFWSKMPKMGFLAEKSRFWDFWDLMFEFGMEVKKAEEGLLKSLRVY